MNLLRRRLTFPGLQAPPPWVDRRYFPMKKKNHQELRVTLTKADGELGLKLMIIWQVTLKSFP